MDGKTSEKSKIEKIHQVIQLAEWISGNQEPRERERENKTFPGRSQKYLIYNFLNNARRRLQWAAKITPTKRMFPECKRERMRVCSTCIMHCVTDKSQLSEQTRTNKQTNKCSL